MTDCAGFLWLSLWVTSHTAKLTHSRRLKKRDSSGTDEDICDSAAGETHCNATGEAKGKANDDTTGDATSNTNRDG